MMEHPITDRKRKREIAEKILREIDSDWLFENKIGRIETALAAYGREQRAQGFREGAEAWRMPLSEPQRIMQTEVGALGNCQSACLAMMLGCELSDVPNFSATPGSDREKLAAQGRWLSERGLWLLTIVKWQSLPWPPPHGFYIAGGVSPRGFRHSVIYKDGALWHDPHPDGGGIADVQDVDLLLPLGFRRLALPLPTPPDGESGEAGSSDIATIYLMGQRKAFYPPDISGWTEVAWERFDYVECGIYTKPVADLTPHDRELVASYGETPDGWIEPAPQPTTT